MSTHPEKPTASRPWTKPLLVAVPLVVLLTFFYTAVQFKEPDFAFVPKGAKVNRFYTFLEKGYGPLLDRSLVEVTEFTWTLEDKDWESVKKAILAKGFLPLHTEEMSTYDTFNHPNGDKVYLPLKMLSWPYAPLVFEHEETRPVHEKIKYFLHWLKNRK